MALEFRLEKLALKRVCADITPHVQKWKNETDEESSEYFRFRVMFADEVSKLIGRYITKKYSEDFLSRYSHELWQAYLDFVFSPSVTKIIAPLHGFPTEVMSAIARNCKHLRCFKACNEVMEPAVYIPFLKSTRQLVKLTLNSCRFADVQIMEVMAESLVHLQILDLEGSNVSDEGVLALCGHKRFANDAIPSCCYSRKCTVRTSLRLRIIGLENTTVSSLGVACILTHIRTIEEISPHISSHFVIPEVMSQIDLYRRMSGMSRLEYQFRRLICPGPVESIRNWESLFLGCPRLERLLISLQDYNFWSERNLAKALVESDLKYLRDVSFQLNNIGDVLNGNYGNFWRHRGSQINFLSFVPLDTHVKYDPQSLRKIVSMCPYVQDLFLYKVILTGDVEKEPSSGELSGLWNLEVLDILMLGEPDSVLSEVLAIISSAENLREIRLKTTAHTETMMNFIHQLALPRLEELRVATIFNS